MTACGAITWALANSWESAGLVSRKSNVPSRMPSISASIEGLITIPIKPVRKKWMPTSTRRSFAVHPIRFEIWLKITDSAKIWVSRLIAAFSSETKKSARYWTRLSRPKPKKALSTSIPCRSPLTFLTPARAPGSLIQAPTAE